MDDGVCGVFIADKLGVSQPTVSEHLRVLSRAGHAARQAHQAVEFYKRDEKRIAELKQMILRSI